MKKKHLWLVLSLSAAFFFLYSYLQETPSRVNLEAHWEDTLFKALFLLASILLNVLFSTSNMHLALAGAFILFLGAWMNFLDTFFMISGLFYLVRFFLYTAGSVLIFVETFKVLSKTKRQILMLRGLFYENNDMVIFYTPDGRIVEMNPAVEKFLHYERVELLGKSVEDIASSNDVNFVVQMMNPLQGDSRKIVPVPERAFLSKDGEIVLCESKLIPLYEGNRLALIQEIARPINEKIETENLLRKERRRFLTYFNNLPVLSVILKKDGTVEDVNNAGCNLLGVNRANLLNKNWFGMFPESFPEKIFEKAFREKLIHEGIIKTSQGERIIRWVFIPLGTDRLLVAGMDVTEERKNLERLRRDRKFYDLLLNLSGNFLSLGWNDFVFKKYVSSMVEIFGAEDLALYEKENSEFFMRVSFKNSFDEKLTNASGDIVTEGNILKIPLEYEGRVFSLIVVQCKSLDESLLEMAKLLKNQLELIYWKLKSEERILWLAEHDSLTGVYNREAFESRLAYLINLSRRYEKKLSFVFIDLDNFKRINDTKGHLVGDHVLKEFAKILSSILRKSDIVGRLGGDEFGIALPETGFDGAETMVRRIKDRFREPVVMGEDHFALEFSYGISVFPDDGESIEELMKIADERMYVDKFKKKRGKEDDR
ncbi:diguanylate cyclase [Thermotoga sp.]|uniref:diguanylate cyclase domain-containing protein n=1 Tax=Thermotoga sp. TaxID=28240 RepID=UPI0025FCC3C2|nr:diguanylate cyclase [Thermotoga sp.]MCD6551310.1 diguanylate cyclase [Thermotoga sp.]